MALSRSASLFLRRSSSLAGGFPEVIAFNQKNRFFIKRTGIPDQAELQQRFLAPYEDVLPYGQLQKLADESAVRNLSLRKLLMSAKSISLKERAMEVLSKEALREEDYFNVENMVSVEEMMAAGVHFGHKYGTWCGAMKPFILGQRHGTHIFNLDETARHLRLALNVISHIVYRGGTVLFLNTRPQFQFMVQKAARDCEEFFVTGRWVGGTLTNSQLLLKTTKLPDVIICMSVLKCRVALQEAGKMGIPTIGICDSDCNPGLVTYTVPGNDDGDSAMELYLRLFCDAIKQAKERQKEDIKLFLETRSSLLDAQGLTKRALKLLQSADESFDEALYDYCRNFKPESLPQSPATSTVSNQRQSGQSRWLRDPKQSKQTTWSHDPSLFEPTTWSHDPSQFEQTTWPHDLSQFEESTWSHDPSQFEQPTWSHDPSQFDQTTGSHNPQFEQWDYRDTDSSWSS